MIAEKLYNDLSVDVDRFSTMESLFVLVTGFGRPNVHVKKQILLHNLTRIKSHNWRKLDVKVCVYDDTDMSDITSVHPEVNVIHQSGIVGEFIKIYAPPAIVATYDYILLILDDVLLQPNVDFAKMIKRKKELGLDIVSPSKTLDSKFVYEYMLTRPQDGFDVKITTVCEYFCFLMDPSSYAVYYKHLDHKNNPWMWGLDLIIYYKMGLRVGMMNDMNMKHFYYKTCYEHHPDKNPFDGLKHCLSKYGIKDIQEFRGCPCELYTIKESLRTL